MLFAASCGSSGQKGGESLPRGEISEGTIIFHDPAKQAGFAKRKNLMPITQIVTTSEKDPAEEDTYQSYAGIIKGAGPTRTSSEKQERILAQRIFEVSRPSDTRRLTPQKFSELWARLDAAGLFKLPSYHGREIPETKPYFLLKSGKSQWVFELPTIQSPPRADDPGVKQLEYWRNAKIELFNFLNYQ